MSRTRTLPAVIAAAAVGLDLLAPAAHADPTPPAGQNLQQVQEADQAQAQQAAANQSEWGKIAEYFCSLDGQTPAINPQQSLTGARDQFSDAGITAYDDAIRTFPVTYLDDPYIIARQVTMGPLSDGSYQAPFGATKADVLRQWRYNVCEVDAYRTNWVAALKKITEQLSTGLKPGLTTEAALRSFYEQKMETIVTVLKAEQARHGFDTDW